MADFKRCAKTFRHLRGSLGTFEAQVAIGRSCMRANLGDPRQLLLGTRSKAPAAPIGMHSRRVLLALRRTRRVLATREQRTYLAVHALLGMSLLDVAGCVDGKQKQDLSSFMAGFLLSHTSFATAIAEGVHFRHCNRCKGVKQQPYHFPNDLGP